MKWIYILFVLVFSSTVLAHEKYSLSIESIKSADPIEEAKKAINDGDLSLLMVADCFTGIQGYTGTGRPEHKPKVLGKSCEELLGTESIQETKMLKDWTKKYNEYIQNNSN